MLSDEIYLNKKGLAVNSHSSLLELEAWVKSRDLGGTEVNSEG